MNISFEYEPTDEDKTLLISILHCTEAELNAKLNKVAEASLVEFRKMILGQKVFTRGSDIMEYRLYLLIKHLFDGMIPDEQSICGLFQVTSNGSRSLIRSIMSKYQYELRDTITDSLKEQVQKITKDPEGDDYKLSIQNQFFKDELNKVLGSIDTSLPMIEKDKGTVSTYVIRASSYAELIAYYGL